MCPRAVQLLSHFQTEVMPLQCSILHASCWVKILHISVNIWNVHKISDYTAPDVCFDLMMTWIATQTLLYIDCGHREDSWEGRDLVCQCSPCHYYKEYRSNSQNLQCKHRKMSSWHGFKQIHVRQELKFIYKNVI